MTNIDAADSANDEATAYIGLCKLWIFADRYRIIGLINHTIDVMSKRLPMPSPTTEGSTRVPMLSTVELVWSKTSQSSPLRTVIMAIFIHHFNLDLWCGKDCIAQLWDRCPTFTSYMLKYFFKNHATLRRKDCPHCHDIQPLYAQA